MTTRDAPAGNDREAAGPQPSKREIAAVVVLYEPDPDVVRNVDSYVRQVDKVVAIDNTKQPGEAIRAELERRGVDYVPLGANYGVAAALNLGCRRARDAGYTWALTMDQDSTTPDGFVANLVRCHDQPGSDAIAIVAPVSEQVGGTPAALQRGCEELIVALTSGNLLRLSAFEALGGFREDLFIDQVDHEFCMRAKQRGWRVVRQLEAVMLHRMGSRRLVTFPVRGRVSDYSPRRRYYMVRNTLELRREYGREFPDWLRGEYRWWCREFLKMMLAEPDRLEKLRMMARGWLDYRRRRFGSYDQLHPG
jgi:rhamnosyltransferase